MNNIKKKEDVGLPVRLSQVTLDPKQSNIKLVKVSYGRKRVRITG